MLGTKKIFHKLSDTDTCALCGEKETIIIIIHMFVEYTISWRVHNEKYTHHFISINVTFGILDILFGYCFNNQN